MATTRKRPKQKAKPKRRKAPQKRPAARKKTVKLARKPARKVSVRGVPPKAARPAAPPPPPDLGERIGVVTHYYGHVSVAVIKLETGTLRVGDVIHIKGHTSDFTQRVDSLQIGHAAVTQVGPQDDFGLKVTEHAREHDVVYKVK